MTTQTTRNELLHDWKALANHVGNVMQSRGETYGGDPSPGFRSVGRIWRAFLEDYFQVELPGEIPPHVVAAMMSGLKLSRFCRPNGYNSDDSLDAIAYSFLADHCVKQEESV